ncbi:MAG TPA: 4a-hydroxytetrahydrobiopterin dehydratase [Candidatus Nanoarchaeia archaeon]|nr:4a-hydroxytetrahydrobiopterin dehydratase [Candidatus Nanoarchaeia archaeon]
MPELSKKQCVPCHEKTGKLEQTEATHLLEELNKWKIIEDKHIEKTMVFKDFASALAFVNKVGEIAEKENHHPDITLFNWNRVKFILSTHSIQGLSENDFILAAKIDELAQ